MKGYFLNALAEGGKTEVDYELEADSVSNTVGLCVYTGCCCQGYLDFNAEEIDAFIQLLQAEKQKLI